MPDATLEEVRARLREVHSRAIDAAAQFLKSFKKDWTELEQRMEKSRRDYESRASQFRELEKALKLAKGKTKD